MNRKWLLAAGTGTLMLMSAVGVGVGHATTLPAKSPAVTRPARGVVSEVKTPVDRDNLQVQQVSQVAQGTDTISGTREDTQAGEADTRVSGGGHADPNGANVNQDFQGVQ